MISTLKQRVFYVEIVEIFNLKILHLNQVSWKVFSKKFYNEKQSKKVFHLHAFLMMGILARRLSGNSNFPIVRDARTGAEIHR